MRELQAKIIEEMGVQPRIDPAGEVRKRVTFLKEYLKATHTKGFVLGISGGLDSSLAGRLAQLAVEELEAEGAEANFVAVRLPYGVQHDEDDAQAALDFIQRQDRMDLQHLRRRGRLRGRVREDRRQRRSPTSTRATPRPAPG